MSTPKKKPVVKSTAKTVTAEKRDELEALNTEIAKQSNIAKAMGRLNAIDAQIAVLGHAAVLIDQMDAFTTKDIKQFYTNISI